MHMETTFALLLASLGLWAPATRASDEAADRFRGQVLATPLGTKVLATLEDGEKVEGELAEAEDESFGLWVEPDEATRERLGLHSPKLKKTIRYDEVAELQGVRGAAALSGEELRFRIRAGDSIRLTTAEGGETGGRVESFDGDILQLDGRSFRLSDGDVKRIEMDIGDSLLNGSLIGLGIGVGWVGLGCAAADVCEADAAVIAALIMGGGLAGLGALIDSANEGSEVVYVSPRGSPSKDLSVVPLFTRDAKGLRFRISF
jgi:hypothetical protein